MSETTNYIPCLDAVGKTALKLLKLFIFLPQADPLPKFPDQAGLLALSCKPLALPAYQ